MSASEDPAVRIRESGLFDAEYYLSTNPDVKTAGVDPLDHYLRHGSFEGRQPSAAFDPSWYSLQVQNVDFSKANALLHFLDIGRSSGKSPSSSELERLILESELFDDAFYLTEYPDVAEARMTPVAHYVRYGWREGRKPGSTFDPSWYLSQVADGSVESEALPPLAQLHSVRHGPGLNHVCRAQSFSIYSGRRF